MSDPKRRRAALEIGGAAAVGLLVLVASALSARCRNKPKKSAAPVPEPAGPAAAAPAVQSSPAAAEKDFAAATAANVSSAITPAGSSSVPPAAREEAAEPSASAQLQTPTSSQAPKSRLRRYGDACDCTAESITADLNAMVKAATSYRIVPSSSLTPPKGASRGNHGARASSAFLSPDAALVCECLKASLDMLVPYSEQQKKLASAAAKPAQSAGAVEAESGPSPTKSVASAATSLTSAAASADPAVTASLFRRIVMRAGLPVESSAVSEVAGALGVSVIASSISN